MCCFFFLQTVCVRNHSVVSDSCDPMDCSLPSSSVYGILQARILEWVTIPFSRDVVGLAMESESPALQENFFLSEPLGKAQKSFTE